MANRPIFIPCPVKPYHSVLTVEFEWNSGLSKSQKRKNVTAIHDVFMSMHPEKKVLEISSKSMQDGGCELSAFNLMKFVPSIGKSVPVESVYHAGKVFKNGGPYTDLLQVSSRESKKDERLQSSGLIIGFRFEDMEFPTQPQSLFYDYLYMNALLENEKLAEVLLQYDGFTDIEFNPQKSIGCQARSAAMFVSLQRLGQLDKICNFNDFLELFDSKIPTVSTATKTESENTSSVDTTPAETVSVSVGDTVVHRVWGKGNVLSVDGSRVNIAFDTVGEKTLVMKWIIDNCKIEKSDE